MDFASLSSILGAFFGVVMIDLVLAGDNAVVIGLAAAGLDPALRKRAIVIGIIAATILRIGFAVVATQLLGIIGLLLAGGLLLLWVAWKMWRELRAHGGEEDAQDIAGKAAPKGFAQAAWAVAIADVSMSLDNVLAVAGAAHAHPGILIIGLILSVVLMGVAANLLARVINRYRWIAYVGLAVILFVACKMIYEGWTNEKVGVITLFT
jgi:YjbE family integral membrane protein